jgi:hypothetical protein
MKKNYLPKKRSFTCDNFTLKKPENFRNIALLSLVLFGLNNIFGQTTYTSGSGNFTVPCDVTSVTVQIWGGGGAGGGGNNNNNGGSGGGAGGYSTSTLSVTAGSTIAYAVGTGGTGNNNTGVSGTATTFGALTANGGSGGGPNQGAIGTGGSASGGTTNTSGNNGSLGTSTVGAAGGNANGGGGAGGVSRNTSGVGNAGTAPGGGGGGGFRTTATNRAGGNGGAGEIRITYTSSLFTYCSPTFTTTVEPITNVTFAGINNTTTNATGGSSLESFCSSATVQQGQTVSISVQGNTVGAFTNYFRLYVDWNKNGTFGDIANEIYDLGTIYNSTGIDATILSSSIAVPIGATLGTTRMRLMKRFSAYSTSPCQTGAGYGQAEDYNVTVTVAPACTTPTAQPTSLNLSSITGSSINGSFTAASPAPSGYIIVRSSSATAPTLVSGTTYAIGYTGLTPGTTYIVQGNAVTSNSVAFSDTGLTSNTMYYYHIFSFNSACAGTPAYLNLTPLTNTAVTCAAAPTLPVNSAVTTNSATVSWTASVAGGGIGAISYTLEVYTNAGYTTPISGSPFSLGAGLTYNLTGLISGTTYYYRIKANNANCDSSYLTGTVSTSITNNQCSTATSLPCGASLAGTNVGAASFTHGSGCTMSNYGVWYTFVGDGNQNVISATTTSFDIEMSISSGSCGALTNIACRDVAFSSGTETYTFNTVLGTTYFVYIADYAAAGTTTGTFTVSRTCVTPLTNDECSTAIALTVTSTCSYTTYTNSGATASTGMTVPGCANYSGGDVWFSVVVPATGQIDIDLQTGVMTDSGIAIYSGTCGALALLDCDDDSSTNGLMSFLSRTGLTPGQTIYIRVWEYGNDNNGTFGICVSTPSCPAPSDLYANILSTTSVTVNWTAPTPVASGGYQYYISNVNTPPTVSTTPAGSTLAGVFSVTLTGLTPGQKYYFWVRSYCGGSDTSAWFGPTNYTPCNVGNGTGTTSLTCPSVLTGGIGMNGGNPPDLVCSALTCTNLEATYLQLNQPTNYTVTSITDAAPYQFTCLQNPVSVNIDDVWSPTINLPFNFCFYGNNYNKCLIGSNGVITFDTTTYTPGGYNEWQFVNNLPNTSLVRNAIFGVYHDIDPSKGGQVGYELITLNTGCRALVASWNDIPMYSAACNSILYTGMIVLYENTNVIEVYIKEKNVCSTWNGGNAIVGLQNAAGNAAVVAPNRNGLDTNWTVTNEAWRFTPSGTSLTTIQWYEGSVATGTPITAPAPVTVGDISTSTISVCPTVTTLYTAEITYTRCNGALKYSDNAVVTVTGNKIWDGSQSADWNDMDNWTPSGVPTSANCVVIPVTPNNPVISNTPDGLGYNLAVYNGAQLTVNSNKNLTITDKVTVQPTGIFTLNNSASLIQINNILNSGNIIYQRTSPNIRTYDYVYWSSPVANFNISNIVAPYTFGPIYHWNTTVANANGGQGTWQNFSGNMLAGKGYIARSPGTAPFNNSTFNPLNGTFTGVPNNGNITLPIERGNDQITANHYGTNGVQITNLSDNWNLLGNPYPSAIRGSQFLFDNNTKIEGNIRLWTHGNLPVYTTNPFYNSFVYNYTSGDYLTYNFTGTSCCPAAGSDLFIGSGQGFFVQMIDGPQVLAAANVTVAFNNNQRSAGFNNSIFYKTTIPSFNTESFNVNDLERNRIWLDLINPAGQSDRTLFGYIESATMGTDSFFDCITQNSGGTLIFSETGDTKFNIQGRSLPFDVNDEVPIGINAPTQGEYTIGIAAVDGLFNSQNIYLTDNLLNITHDLKASPYHFTTQSGGVYDRFKVIYVDNALGIPTHPFDENSIKVVTNNEVAVSSSNLIMESIVVYNLLGQKLDTYNNVNSRYVILSNLQKNNATLLLKIKLQTGETVTKKIIF